MTPYEEMQFAAQNTEILRMRKNLLYTFGNTRLPYVVISESPRDAGEVIVRKGEVTADRPKIAIPDEPFQFEGFDMDGDEKDVLQIMLARRVQMPPAKYINKSESTMTKRGEMSAIVEEQLNLLDKANDIRTALLAAPDRVWNMSVLIYVGSQVARSAPSNIEEHFERIRLRGD